MEYGNGIMGDMGVHMFDMTRWLLGLGWPKRISPPAASWSRKQGQHHRYADSPPSSTTTSRLSGSIAPGAIRPTPSTPGAPRSTATKARSRPASTATISRPRSKASPVHKDVTYELEQYPEDKTEKDLEKQCAPAIRHHMQDFLAAIATRGKPVADIEQGYISTTSCILANLSMRTRPHAGVGSANGRVIGDDEANRLLARPYRSPWVHPSQESM